MKRYIALISVVLCIGCSTNQTLIDTGIDIGTTTGLRFAFKDPAKRAVVANYIDVAAVALRSVTGTPNPNDLTAQINQWIPANIKSNYPEVLAFVEPLVIAEYQSLYAKYGSSGNGQRIAAGLNQIATDLEAGAAPYITKTP